MIIIKDILTGYTKFQVVDTNWPGKLGVKAKIKDILTGCWLIYQVRLAGGKVFSLVQLILISSPTEYLVIVLMMRRMVVMVRKVLTMRKVMVMMFIHVDTEWTFSSEPSLINIVIVLLIDIFVKTSHEPRQSSVPVWALPQQGDPQTWSRWQRWGPPHSPGDQNLFVKIHKDCAYSGLFLRMWINLSIQTYNNYHHHQHT